MRKFITLFAIIVLPKIILAQLNYFDLSSYKLPEMTRHQIDLNLDLTGFSDKSDQNYKFRFDSYTNQNSINGGLDLDYSFYRNSENFQLNHRYSFNFNSIFENQKDKENTLLETFKLYTNLSADLQNRFYFNAKNYFEVDFLLQSRLSNENYNDQPFSTDHKNNYIGFSIPLYIGIGRIEPVQDCWLAIYILDELNKNDKLIRIPSDEEIIEFSQLISKLKNERFFDSRLKKIHEIEEVDSFLQAKGLINISDAKYFTIVYDNWDNSASISRSTGHRISFGIDPEIHLNNHQSEMKNDSLVYETEINHSEYSVKVNIQYVYEKPINIKWQSSLFFITSGIYFKSINDVYSSVLENKIELNAPQIGSLIKYKLGFYPNSRTNFDVSFALDFFNSFGKEVYNNIENKINHLVITPRSYLNLYYYISPQLRLNLYYSIDYNYTESDSRYYLSLNNDFIKYNSLNQYLTAGLLFQIR